MSAFRGWIAQHARERPKHPALISGKITLSFAELDDAARSLAARLRGLGIEAGDRVAVLLENEVLYVELIHALISLGAVLVPLNLRLTPRELRGLLEATHAKLLLHGAELGALVAAARRNLPGLKALSTSALRVLPEQPAAPSHALELAADHAILFTSGTTGHPKGVRLTLANHVASAYASAQRLGVHPQDRWLACMPLYHVGGLAIVLRSAIYGTSVVLQARFDARTVMRSLQRDRITAISLVPTMLTRLLDAAAGASFPAALRFVLLGGGPIPEDLVRRATRKGVPIAPTYGLTEAASQVATLAPEEAEAHGASIGRALPGLELRVVDAQNRDQPPTMPGEICVRGPQVMAGYLDRPDETQRVLREGWLHTGDIGALSSDGYLTLLDRRSDLIVSGGENVYPAEVEAGRLSHPDVAAAVVVGRPDPTWGQVVHAFVVAKLARKPLPQELIAYCRGRLAGFKLPRRVHLVPSLPRTPSGKLRREELRGDT